MHRTLPFSLRAIVPAAAIVLACIAYFPFALLATPEAEVANLEWRINGLPGKQSRSLVLTQFDVGQGDAALITTPGGKRILIDAGPHPTAIAGQLLAAGIDTLDLVVASHNHADHIGGMAEVFRRLVVRAYMDNGMTHTTSTYRRTFAAMQREPNLQYLSATPRSIFLDSVVVEVLPPPRLDDTQNNNSVGLIISYRQFAALFTGDSERTELRAWLRQSAIRRVAYVKAAHHGSSNGFVPELARLARPAIVVASLGRGNGYGHPSKTTLAHWERGGARVFRTDIDGTIRLETRGDGRLYIRTTRF